MQSLVTPGSLLSFSSPTIFPTTLSKRYCNCPSFPAPLSASIILSPSSIAQHAQLLSGLTATKKENKQRRTIRAASTAQQQASSSPVVGGVGGVGVGVGQQSPDDRVIHITTVEEFDEALRSAKRKLVVVEYAATHSVNSRRIYPAMVDLSKTLKGVVFLLVLGDESDATRELCERAGIQKVPHFVFYKNSQKIHEEEGITSDQLEGDVLYYGDIDAPIHQVHGKKDFEVLFEEHASDNKLVVLDVGLKSCGPCVKIYPTVVKLAKRMVETTVFARMHGDENDECEELLKSMGVVEVPTFLFIRDGKLLGRYVGSGRGELVGEILKYNGVRCT